MKAQLCLLALLGVVLLGVAAAPEEKGPRWLYYEAFHAEAAEADWSRAADLYEKVVASPEAPANLKERARQRLTHCLEKLGLTDDTRPTGREPGATRRSRMEFDHIDLFGAKEKTQARCLPCHIPHPGDGASPKWDESAQRPRLWTSGGESSPPAGGVVSALCGSCHDGFIEECCGNGSSGLGTRPHPVGVVYRGPVTGEDGDKMGPAPPASGAQDPRATLLPLYDRRVECTTCHSEHRGANPEQVPGLRLKHEGGLRESELCRRCHLTEQESPVFFPGASEAPKLQHLVSYVGVSDSSPTRRSVVLSASDKLLAGAELGTPYGLALADGMLLLCDRRGGGVLAFDLGTGSFRGRHGSDVLKRPTNLVRGPTGKLLVTDSTLGVQVLDLSGQLLRILGAPGKKGFHGLVVAEKQVLVTDWQRHRIEAYDRESGEALDAFEVSSPGEEGDRDVPGWPTDLALDPDGNLLVTDATWGHVQRWSPSGERLQVFGGGYLGKPKGIACDRDGRIYVVDAGHAEVLVIDPQGDLLLPFGQPVEGERGRLHRPAQVTVDYEHVGLFARYVSPAREIEYLVAVTDQTGPRLVEVYGFLKARVAGSPQAISPRDANPRAGSSPDVPARDP